MISVDKEFYSSPYYFFLRNKGDKYSLYFSSEETLREARKKDEVIHFDKKDGKKVKNYLEKITKEKKKKSTKTIKTDLEELVNSDGAMSNSAIPILDPRLHPKKTMDQTVSMARITNDPIARGYRTYYGESVEESKETEIDMKGKKCKKCKKGKYFEMGMMDDLSGTLHCNKCNHAIDRYAKKIEEIDMSGAFGYEETEDMDGKDTYKFLVKNMGMEPDEAKDRTKQQGKDPSGKKDKKSKFYKDPNFITRATLSEIQKQKAIKVVEDMLAKKKNSDSADINKKDIEVSRMLKRNLSVLKKQAEKEGVSITELIKMLKSE